MSSVRKRGKTWTAQVRITGWRSFTKTFNKKSDAGSCKTRRPSDRFPTVLAPSGHDAINNAATFRDGVHGAEDAPKSDIPGKHILGQSVYGGW